MLFRSPAIKWQAVSLGVLMILSAVTEGIGLVMLVPLLEAVGSGGTSGTLLPTPFADFDYALSLGSMLALFVGLIAHPAQSGSNQLWPTGCGCGHGRRCCIVTGGSCRECGGAKAPVC
jgi:hypothetical protein